MLEVKVGQSVYFNSFSQISILTVTKVTKTFIEAVNADNKSYKFTLRGDIYGNKSDRQCLLHWTEADYKTHLEQKEKKDRLAILKRNILDNINNFFFLSHLDTLEEINSIIEKAKEAN